MKKLVHGYKMNNYNATYEETDFIFEEKVVDENQRNIRITEFSGGLELILLVETPSERKKKPLGYK